MKGHARAGKAGIGICHGRGVRRARKAPHHPPRRLDSVPFFRAAGGTGQGVGKQRLRRRPRSSLPPLFSLPPCEHTPRPRLSLPPPLRTRRHLRAKSKVSIANVPCLLRLRGRLLLLRRVLLLRRGGVALRRQRRMLLLRRHHVRRRRLLVLHRGAPAPKGRAGRGRLGARQVTAAPRSPRAHALAASRWKDPPPRSRKKVLNVVRLGAAPSAPACVPDRPVIKQGKVHTSKVSPSSSSPQQSCTSPEVKRPAAERECARPALGAPH